MLCRVTPDIIKNAIIDNAVRLAVNSNDFKQAGYNTLIATKEDVQGTVNAINDAFQEPIIKPLYDTQRNFDELKAKKWLSDNIPNLPVQFQEELISMGKVPGFAWGKFGNSLATVSQQSPDIFRTTKHEAGHAIFSVLPAKQREELLNEGAKEYGIKRGQSSATVKYSQAQQNQINYLLKSVDILQSQKAIDWFKKRDKAQWKDDTFWQKLQQDLQIPKEQIGLLRAQSVNNPYNREQLLTSLVANYSYTIEVNTAKYRPPTYDYEPGMPREMFTTGVDQNAQYYSNLTVPGGTNYTERNFETPLIKVPKSHAQFNTENTIGFTRGDDRIQYSESDIDSLISTMEKSGILKINCA